MYFDSDSHEDEPSLFRFHYDTLEGIEGVAEQTN